MSDTPILWEETVPGGATWSHVLKRGTALRITDTEGGANAGALFYNFECPGRALQHAGHPQGAAHRAPHRRLRPLLRHGPHPLLHHRRHRRLARPARRLLQRRAGRRTLRRRHAIRSAATTRTRTRSTASWSNSASGDSARATSSPTSTSSAASRSPTTAPCTISPAIPQPGDYVELRAEMNVLVILNTCQHPLDPAPKYAPKPVHLSIRGVGPPGPTTRAASRAPKTDAASPSPRGTSYDRQQRRSADLASAVYSEVIPAGEPWIHEIEKGQIFRIVDLHGNQAVDTLFYNAHDYSDRYSAQDTIREQNNIYLTTGTQLMSTRGTVLLTIVADTCGRHDTLGGACANESNMVRYAIEKRFMHACRSSFLKGRAGLGPRHGQARHHQQHQLLHERAGHARRQADLRRRHLRARQIRRAARRNRRAVRSSATARSSTIPATPTTPRRCRC